MKIFLLILLAFVSSCAVQQAQVAQKNSIPIIPADSIPEPPVEETKIQSSQTKVPIEKRLKYYLYDREITPSVVINNTDRDQTEIKLEDNKIEWIRGDKEAKVKINGDLITLKDKSSLNNADVSGKIQGDMVDNWRQIKLFKVNNRKLIGIEMGSEFCTGLMCSVTFFLIYDLETKSTNFFGDFRIDHELKLYDFKNDGTIDFLSTTNVGFTYTENSEFKHLYELYALDEKGSFQRQLDTNQKPYYFNRTFKTLEVRDRYDEDYRELDNKFERNWIEEIN
jgi:hypothetical protein